MAVGIHLLAEEGGRRPEFLLGWLGFGLKVSLGIAAFVRLDALQAALKTLFSIV